MCSVRPSRLEPAASAFIRVRDGGEIDSIGAIKDNLSEEQKAELLSRTGAETGTLILFGAGDTATVNKALDRVRQYLARELGMVKPDRENDQWNFLWVVDFPMFEFNSDENRYEALHHLLRPQHRRPRQRRRAMG